jgi:hypothetical protein
MVVPSKGVSFVWKYFRVQEGQVDQKQAFCLLCKCWKSWAKSTSNLIYHLNSIHKIAPPANPDQRQPTLRAMPSLLTDGRKSDITRAIAKMMVKDLEPFSLVEREGFRDLVRLLEPRYEMPHRQYFSRTLIPTLHTEEQVKTKGILFFCRLPLIAHRVADSYRILCCDLRYLVVTCK